MGTNYYWIAKRSTACPTCGHETEPKQLHIGKSSAGWVFALHVYPDLGINTLYDWIERFLQSGSRIVDEYGGTVDFNVGEILDVIMNRRSAVNKDCAWFVANRAVLGPNGLARSIPANGITHGEGTWDYHSHDFI